MITDEYGRRRESFADVNWNLWPVETHMLWAVDGLVTRLPAEDKAKGKWVKPTKTTPSWVSEEWANTYHFDYRDAELQIARAAAGLDEVKAPASGGEANEPPIANLISKHADPPDRHTHVAGVTVAEGVGMPEGSSQLLVSQRVAAWPPSSGLAMPRRPEEEETPPGSMSRCKQRTGLSTRLKE